EQERRRSRDRQTGIPRRVQHLSWQRHAGFPQIRKPDAVDATCAKRPENPVRPRHSRIQENAGPRWQHDPERQGGRKRRGVHAEASESIYAGEEERINSRMPCDRVKPCHWTDTRTEKRSASAVPAYVWRSPVSISRGWYIIGNSDASGK